MRRLELRTIQPHRGQVLGCRLSLLIFVLAPLLTATGCQVFTREAGLKRLREENEAAQAEIRRSENEALQKRLEEEHAKLDQKYKVLEKRNSLQRRRFEASEALGRGEAVKAVEELQAIIKEATGDAPAEGVSSEESQIFDPRELARTHALLGQAWFQQGKKDEAILALRQAVALDPESSPYRRNLGKLLLMGELFQEALDVYRGELEKGLRDADLLFPVAQAHFLLGQKENDSGRIEAARVALQTVLVERPADPEVRRWLARLEYETGRYDEAARLFESIRKESPLEPQYLEYLANCYAKLKEYQKAADYLELSARVSRPTADACRTLGDLYTVLNLPGRAAEWLARANGGDPGKASPEDRLQIGMLFLEAARSDDAVRWIEAVQEGEKPYAEAQSALAYLYHDLGRMDEALQAFERVSRVRPQDGQALLSAGDIYRTRKELDRAADAYARASALPESRAEGFAGLAEIAYDRGSLEDAVRQYQKAADASPGDQRYASLLRQAREELQIKKDLDVAQHQGG